MEAKKARKNAAMEKNKIKEEAAEAKMGKKGKEQKEKGREKYAKF